MTGSDDKHAASWSLRRSLTRMLLLAALLPVLVFGIALLWSQWQRDRDELLLRLSTSAQSSASTFDDFLDSHLAGVRLLAATPLAASASPPDAALDRLLSALRAQRLGADALKAVVTPTNRSWTFAALLDALAKERAHFAQQREASDAVPD